MHSFYDSLAAALADRFFRGWLFLNIGGFPDSNPDSAASIRPRSNYEFFFFSISDPLAPVRYLLYLYRRISEIQPTGSERAASFLRECRPLFQMLPLGAGRYCSIIFWLLWPRFFSIKTIRLVRLVRAAQLILTRDFKCFWFFSELFIQWPDDVFCHSPQL